MRDPLRLAHFVVWGLMVQGCSSSPFPMSVAALPSAGAATSMSAGVLEGWTTKSFSGHLPSAEVVVLHRPARVQPARYRVVVIPGAGCTRWMRLAEHYFAGSLRADWWVLHKPHVDVLARPEAECTDTFNAHDSLGFWRDAASSALTALSATFSSQIPTLLLGISEGAELLPQLAAALPDVSGLVMVSSVGLDPVVAGEMHATHIGQVSAWKKLDEARASGLPDEHVVQGRTLRYWRDFWGWSLTEPLIAVPLPLLRVWGDADATLPVDAYLLFNRLAVERNAHYCDVRLMGADHALQAPTRDGIQWLLRQLDRWSRQTHSKFCDVITAPR